MRLIQWLGMQNFIKISLTDSEETGIKDAHIYSMISSNCRHSHFSLNVMTHNESYWVWPHFASKQHWYFINLIITMKIWYVVSFNSINSIFSNIQLEMNVYIFDKYISIYILKGFPLLNLKRNMTWNVFVNSILF